MRPRPASARPGTAPRRRGPGAVLSSGYVVRRILQMVPTLVFILVVTFVLVRLLPGDPLSAIAGDRVTGRPGGAARAKPTGSTSRS